nr:MAG TPA: hypothetical protein [Caudoviricetes sp.]
MSHLLYNTKRHMSAARGIIPFDRSRGLFCVHIMRYNK